MGKEELFARALTGFLFLVSLYMLATGIIGLNQMDVNYDSDYMGFPEVSAENGYCWLDEKSETRREWICQPEIEIMGQNLEPWAGRKKIEIIRDTGPVLE